MVSYDDIAVSVIFLLFKLELQAAIVRVKIPHAQRKREEKTQKDCQEFQNILKHPIHWQLQGAKHRVHLTEIAKVPNAYNRSDWEAAAS